LSIASKQGEKRVREDRNYSEKDVKSSLKNQLGSLKID
jgi:hypothetical protein